MFSSHKQLIGSPNSPNDRLNSNSEFTPIGVRSRNTNVLLTNSAKIRSNIDGSPPSANTNGRSQLLHRNKFDGSSSSSNDNSDVSNSSFENDENEDDYRNVMRHNKKNLFSNGAILRGTSVLPNYSSDEESIGTLKEDGFIKNKETNMLKLQSDQVKNLQGENMNLRVEVMSLRRNLTGLPVETNELIDQNITLNQEIVRLRELLENYRLGENKADDSNNENADYRIQFKQYEDKIENLENKLHVIIDERDDKAQEIERLNDHVDILNNKLEQKNLEIEERRLHGDSVVSIHNTNDQELNDIETDLKFREQEIDNLHDEIEELNLKLKHLTKENNLLREDLDEIETGNKIGSESNKSQDFEHQKIELQTRIDQLEKDLRETKLEKVDLKKYINNLEDDEEKKVRKQYKSSRDLLRDMSDQLDNASKSIDTLENELKQKDSDIKQLNSEIFNLQTKNSELIERLEKLKNSKSKTTDLLTNEIDEVYAKINELKEINIKLESENHELSQSLSNNEGYDNDYVEDIKEDREILYNSLLKTEKKLIEKLSEIKSLKDKIQNLEKKLESNDKINEEPRNGENPDENIELVNNLQLRIEEERDKHIETIQSLESKFNDEKNNFIHKIETLEDDKLRLIEDYENIQIAYKDLEADFEKEVNQSAIVSDFNDLESDFKNLSIQYKIAVDDKLIYETEIEELKSKIKLKDVELVELHNDLTEFSKLEKSTDIRTKLESKIILIEQQVVKLTNERNKLLDNNLQNDEESNKLRLENIKLNKEVDLSKKICSQFETQLDEANKDKKVLRLELKEQNREINKLEKNISKLEIERGNLVKSLDKLNNDQNNIIKKNDQLSDNLKSVFKDHGENNELETKFKEKENQFNRLVDEYNSMKDDLIGKYEDLKLERVKLADKLIEKDKILTDAKRKFELSNGKVKVLEKYVDEQNKDIDSIRVELENARDQLQDQKQWFPPTPESPSHITNNQQSRIFTLQNRIDILEAQKKLMMIKLQELKTESGDLQFMIQYLEAEIKSKNGTIEKNIILLRTANINTISSSKKNKLTFRGVAFAVLASIRLKNRLNELKIRRAQEIAVKKQLSQKQKHL